MWDQIEICVIGKLQMISKRRVVPLELILTSFNTFTPNGSSKHKAFLHEKQLGAFNFLK